MRTDDFEPCVRQLFYISFIFALNLTPVPRVYFGTFLNLQTNFVAKVADNVNVNDGVMLFTVGCGVKTLPLLSALVLVGI